MGGISANKLRPYVKSLEEYNKKHKEGADVLRHILYTHSSVYFKVNDKLYEACYYEKWRSDDIPPVYYVVGQRLHKGELKSGLELHLTDDKTLLEGQTSVGITNSIFFLLENYKKTWSTNIEDLKEN